MAFRFELLGPVRMLADDHCLPELAPRHRAVLAYLLLHPRLVISVDRLIEAIWGPTPPDTARAQIQSTAAAIRRALRAGGADDDLLATRPAGYVITPEPAQVDLDEFITEVAAAQALADRSETGHAVQRLRAALALWRGLPLEDLTADYVETARARLRDRRLTAVEQLAELELSLGRHEQLVDELSAEVCNHPLRERLTSQFMLALHRSGRRVEALEVARDYRSRLAEQQGLDPGKTFAEREQAILRDESGVTSPELPDDRADRPQDGNLPADVTSFVGRKRELAEIKHVLSVSRLVTLIGVGGVGKTRLALRAAELHRAFDAVWFVDFSSVSDPALVVQTVSTTLGLRDDPSSAPLDALSKVLASQRTLLLLDNCEHLLQACASLADQLLRAAPELRILATSRQSLGIMAEHQSQVAPLPVPEPDQPPELNDAVTLLVERAAAVVPGFTLNEDNRADVVRLCRHLDGIPLAIELAAVRLRALSVSQLAERLAERYRWLTRGSRTSIARHQTLHALIDWSYQLLAPIERRLWACASIFPGHFGLEAAEEICSGDGTEREDVLDLLDALIDRSLLLREEHGGQVRYRMLETIREFGQLQLTGPEERRALQRRHRDCYRELVERAAAEWFGPEQAAWSARLKLEHAHLRAALDFCLREPGEVEAGLGMAADLVRPLWLGSAFFGEGRHWLGLLLHAGPEPTIARARALCAAAWVELSPSPSSNTVADQEPLVDQARELADELDDRTTLATIAMISGLAAHYEADDVRAATLLEEAIAGHTATGDQFGFALSLAAQALTVSFLGDAARAAELFEQSLQETERHGERWCRAWALTAYAVHTWRLGDPQRAITLAREGLEVGLPLQDRLLMAISMETMGFAMADLGQYESAARLLGAALGVAHSVGVTPFLFWRFIAFHDRYVALLAGELGEKACGWAMGRGRELTVRQAIAEALGTPAERQEPAPTASSSLTAREQEIAELIAQGLSNRQIADTLVIAQRTSEGHVQHILDKLGFQSRAQIAAWMAARSKEG
ncbi:BTAD domain-containing putative transcriptional regulator [Nonomuraea sp. NPDC050536]|uniref:BTAD domain-containing putative transcriptional regulator n=1 Tax=Nonomuraea sp. NPDC050536 TaxID=3364366 RepID=UPI0037C77BF9